MNDRATTELSEAAQADREVIVSLVESIIDHRESLVLEAKEVPGQIYWTMWVHPEDQGKVLGKLGSHIMAIQHILKKMGRTRETLYTLVLEEPEHRMRSEPRRPRPAAQAYNSTVAEAIMVNVLESMGVDGLHIAVNTEREGEFWALQFTISVKQEFDYEMLTMKDPKGLTTIACLGTLFRAYGNRDGCKFTVSLTKP